MKKILASVLVILGLDGMATAATFGTAAVYTQTSRNREAPTKLVIRCQGWTEDSINTLDLVVFERDPQTQLVTRAVYRCVAP